MTDEEQPRGAIDPDVGARLDTLTEALRALGEGFETRLADERALTDRAFALVTGALEALEKRVAKLAGDDGDDGALVEIQAEVAGLKTRLAALEGRVPQAVAEAEARIGAALGVLRARADQVEEDVEAFGKDTAGLDNRALELEQQVAALATRLTALEGGEPVPEPEPEPEPPTIPPEPKPPAAAERIVPKRPEVDRTVNAGMSHAAIQGVLDSHLQVGFSSGNYGAFRPKLRDGHVLVGVDADYSTFDGGGQSAGWCETSAHSVHLQHLRVIGWNTPPQHGALHPNNHLGNGPSKGWRIIDCEFVKNGGRGCTLPGPGSVVSHSKFLHNRGNQGLGGDLSVGQRVLWNYSRGNNPTSRDRFRDGASFFKGAAGRSNLGLPVARDIIIRGNYSDGRDENGKRCGGCHIWLDWDYRDALIELNFCGWGINAGIIAECGLGVRVLSNYCYANAGLYGEKMWVRAMYSEIACQNSPEMVATGNLLVPIHGECFHVTQQCRTGKGATHTPQGGPGAGIFQSRDLATSGNLIYRPGQHGNAPTTMYVDRPGVLQPDRSRRGRAEELKSMQGTSEAQCRWFFDQYPEGSPWHDGRGNGQDTLAFALMLEHSAAALRNDLSGFTVMNAEPPSWDEWCARHGYPKP